MDETITLSGVIVRRKGPEDTRVWNGQRSIFVFYMDRVKGLPGWVNLCGPLRVRVNRETEKRLPYDVGLEVLVRGVLSIHEDYKGPREVHIDATFAKVQAAKAA